MREVRLGRATKVKKFVIAGAIALSVITLPAMVYAVSEADGTTINATIGSTISILSTGTVNLAITPVSGGSQTTASDSLIIATNNTSGYTLSLKDSDSTTSLTKGSDTILASSATVASSAILSNNTWGFRVDDATIGDFGAGPTTATSDQTSNSTKFAGIKATDATIKSTSSTTPGDTVYVWYSAKADSSKPNGQYSDTVTYTATTNN